jgi:quinol monooxygenase YgiN
MTLVIAGTVRVPPQNMSAIRPHMIVMIEATRAEDGCRAYAFAEDVGEAGLIHIFEIWRDAAALAVHGKSAHMAAWRAIGADMGVFDRNLAAYDVASERPL